MLLCNFVGTAVFLRNCMIAPLSSRQDPCSLASLQTLPIGPRKCRPAGCGAGWRLGIDNELLHSSNCKTHFDLSQVCQHRRHATFQLHALLVDNTLAAGVADECNKRECPNLSTTHTEGRSAHYFGTTWILALPCGGLSTSKPHESAPLLPSRSGCVAGSSIVAQNDW